MILTWDHHTWFIFDNHIGILSYSEISDYDEVHGFLEAMLSSPMMSIIIRSHHGCWMESIFSYDWILYSSFDSADVFEYLIQLYIVCFATGIMTLRLLEIEYSSIHVCMYQDYYSTGLGWRLTSCMNRLYGSDRIDVIVNLSYFYMRCTKSGCHYDVWTYIPTIWLLMRIYVMIL